MALSTNPYRRLSTAQILIIQAEYLNCVMAIAQIGQSYSMNGRTFTHADLGSVESTLSQLQDALDIQSGRGVAQAQATL